MVPVPIARRLVRIPVLPNATVSKAATFCVNGGGAANARPNPRELSTRELRFEPRVVELTQAPATPAAPASRNFLRSMPPSGCDHLTYFRPVRRGWETVGYRAVFRTCELTARGTGGVRY